MAVRAVGAFKIKCIFHRYHGHFKTVDKGLGFVRDHTPSRDGSIREGK